MGISWLRFLGVLRTAHKVAKATVAMVFPHEIHEELLDKGQVDFVLFVISGVP